MSTNIKEELIVRVTYQLCLQALSNLSTESSLVLHICILTKSQLEELLVYLMLLETLDFCNLIAELRLQILHRITLNLQELSYLCIVIWISLLRIECDDITYLCLIEKVLLLFYLNVAWHHNGSLYSNATFLGVTILVQLTQVTLQHIILLINLSLLIATRTRSIHFYLLIKNLIINSDIVVIYLITTRKSNLELWSNSDVKHECIRTILLNINWLLLL